MRIIFKKVDEGVTVYCVDAKEQKNHEDIVSVFP